MVRKVAKRSKFFTAIYRSNRDHAPVKFPLEPENKSIRVILDLARSYLTAIQSGVPEEMKIPKGGFYGVNSCCEYREIDVWNACRSQMLALLVAEKEKVKNLASMLEICEGAIKDAIYCEDGLDGGKGEDLLNDIEKLKVQDLSKCLECDHLAQENLKIKHVKPPIQDIFLNEVRKYRLPN